MDAETLSGALEREHHEIDEGLAVFIREASNGDISLGPLHRAFDLLRRHIYLEETILFPPLRAAGLLGPVLVMLREHGEIWREMDAVQAQDRDGATHDDLVAATERLLEDLARHNAKEEPILYPQADLVLNGAQQDELRQFLESGRMPDGWVAEQAVAARDKTTAPLWKLRAQEPTKNPGKERLSMTTKGDFSEEEWTRIMRAPFVAGLAISLADPGGPIEAAKESMATLKSATNPPSREPLLANVALDVQAMAQQHHHPLSGFKPTAGEGAGSQVLDELRAVMSLVSARASHEEAVAYGAWLLASAKAAADAAKEGGFMGFHAEQVSQREEAMLNQVREAVIA